MIKQEILKRDNFTCQKCGFKSEDPNELEIKNSITLCSICHKHAPDNENEFKKYIKEKIDGTLLNTFRDSQYSISKKTKTGMGKVYGNGKHISKAPKGYKLVNKKLVPNEEAETITKIFEEYLNTMISLTQLAKKHGMTTSGIKKLLMNTTYLGKVKFANEESDGQHQPILGQHLFEQVQNKLGVKQTAVQTTN
jgi:Recombinase